MHDTEQNVGLHTSLAVLTPQVGIWHLFFSECYISDDDNVMMMIAMIVMMMMMAYVMVTILLWWWWW